MSEMQSHVVVRFSADASEREISFDRMVVVQGAGGLDDGGGGRVSADGPRVIVFGQEGEGVFEPFVDARLQVAFVRQEWLENQVFVANKVEHVALWRIGRHEDGDKGASMASFVEILEVECIIPYLSNVGSLEAPLVDFKLQDKYNSINEDDGINASPQAGDVVFKVNTPSARILFQNILQQVNFFLPRVSLVDGNVVRTLANQFSDNGRSILVDEIAYRA